MEICLCFCNTRTRQASQRCSNVRVVLFLYLWQTKFRFKRHTTIHTILSRCSGREAFDMERFQYPFYLIRII